MNNSLKGGIYYPLVSLFILLGLTFSIILTYNFYTKNYYSKLNPKIEKIDVFCGKSDKDSIVNCDKVSADIKNSTFPGDVPIALWGIGFYLVVILYYLFPTMNRRNSDYLKVPFLFMMIAANLVDIGLLFFSIFKIKAICGQCIVLYVSNLAIIILLYFRDFRGNLILKEIAGYFKKLFNRDYYQKEIAMYAVLSLLLFSLLFMFNNNQLLAFKKAKNTDPNKQLIAKVFENRKKEFLSRPVIDLKLTNEPGIGSLDAPITLIVYHDLQCHNCRKSYHDLEKVVEDFSPLVQIRYKNYPFLGSNKNSQLTSFQLAQYSMVAHEKGKYLDFVTELFKREENNEYIDKAKLKEIFESIQFEIPFDQIDQRVSKYIEPIKKEITALEKFYVENKFQSGGTPTIVLNNRILSVGYNKDYIKYMINHYIVDYAKKKYEEKSK